MKGLYYLHPRLFRANAVRALDNNSVLIDERKMLVTDVVTLNGRQWCIVRVLGRIARRKVVLDTVLA
jgi:hypothetical protein